MIREAVQTLGLLYLAVMLVLGLGLFVAAGFCWGWKAGRRAVGREIAKAAQAERERLARLAAIARLPTPRRRP